MKYTAGMLIEADYGFCGSGAGSLGCFARDSQNQPVLVTCSHVIFPGFNIPNRIYHPNYSPCCSSGDPMASPLFDKSKKAEVGNKPVKDDPEAEDPEVVDFYGGFRDGKWYGGFNGRRGLTRVRGTQQPMSVSEVDCAVAKLDPGAQFHNVWHMEVQGNVLEIPLKGADMDGSGVPAHSESGVLPSEDQYVRIYSQNSGYLKYGTLLRVPHDVIITSDYGLIDTNLLFPWAVSDKTDVRAGVRALVNQMVFLPRPPPDPNKTLKQSYRNLKQRLSIDGGDSGSMVINAQGTIIGMITRQVDPDMLFDKPPLEIDAVSYLGFVTPIKRVLEHLNVEVPEDAAGYSGTAPARGTAKHFFVRSPEVIAQRAALAAVRAQMLESRKGRLLLGKIRQHRDEIAQLLVRVRSVNAAWTHFQGPAWFNHCLRSLTDAAHVIPDEINGVSREQLATALLASVQGHASPRLTRDIARYAQRLRPLLQVTRVADAPDLLKAAG